MCKDRPTDEIKEVLKKIYDMGVMKVCFSHGESLLRKDIIEIISYCDKLGLYTILLTNGYLLTDILADKLKKARVGKITISLDSLDEKYHDELRGVQLAWQKAVEAMSICRKHGIKFSVNTTLNSSSVKSLEEHIEFAVEQGASDIFFLTIRSQSGQKHKNIWEIKNYPELIKAIWRLKKAYGDRIAVGFHDPLAMSVLKDEVSQEDYAWVVRENQCNAGKLWSSVLPTGDVRPCNFLPVVIGNIYNDRIEDIWNRDNMCKKVSFLAPNGCSNCGVKLACRGGCKSFSVANNNKDIRCKLII